MQVVAGRHVMRFPAGFGEDQGADGELAISRADHSEVQHIFGLKRSQRPKTETKEAILTRTAVRRSCPRLVWEAGISYKGPPTRRQPAAGPLERKMRLELLSMPLLTTGQELDHYLRRSGRPQCRNPPVSNSRLTARQGTLFLQSTFGLSCCLECVT